MHTLLSKFCEEFVQTIRPVLEPLTLSAEAISESPQTAPENTIHEELVDLRHQIDLLSNKVAEQQAYVLIFGPLKSGKSTLMNAISASYVSEVSSLPAYPCMVFVSHGRKKEYTVQHYNGTVRNFEDTQAAQDYVDQAHSELATRIRQNEASGLDFDPLHNFKAAIRRMDVRFPIDVLEPSKAVLVDTPGLYSRMKFGYDRMTRDFRNAAACAVFVVRSDNLFLDQVFEEFNKLLQLFSRIFLVVNVDTRKQDCNPNGQLVPSLEQRDPQRIIRAFENLTMSAPLKKAAKEGRLRIYPVDLLEAASRRLRARHDSNTGKGEKLDPSSSHSGEIEFDRFFKDLTEYLNSTDYLVAFLGDSLRRATTLLTEVKAVCESPAVVAIQKKTLDLDKQAALATERLKTTKRLGASDWKKGFDWLLNDTDRVLKDLANDINDKTVRLANDKVNQWFKSGESLEHLIKNELNPIFSKNQNELTEALSKELSERLVAGHAGIRVSDEVDRMLRDVRIDLAEIGRKIHHDTKNEATPTTPHPALGADDIPVRKNLWDWVMLRSKNSVRRRLFGPSESPKQSIASELKTARLGDNAKAEMRRMLERYQREFFAGTRQRVHAAFMGKYCDAVMSGLRESLVETKSRLEKELSDATRDQARYRNLLEPMRNLTEQTKKAQSAVKSLSDHYGQMDLYLLTKPVMPDYRLPRNGGQKPTAAEVPTADAPATKPAGGDDRMLRR